MVKHYSEGLGRNFQDEDWLTISEVKDIVSANSQRTVGVGTVSSYLRRHKEIPKRDVNSQVKLYPYKEIKAITIPDQRGPKLLDDPSDLALRQRKFQERKRLKKAQEQIQATTYSAISSVSNSPLSE